MKMDEATPDFDESSAAREFDAIVDEILTCRRSGQVPQLADFLERYPAHTDNLREHFSTLLWIEQLEGSSRGAPEVEPTDSRGNVEAYPSRLGDFELRREVGRGGMGVVFAAWQVSLNRPVAIKVLNRHLAANPKFLERFQREARSAANLQHPHIVSVFGNGTEQGISYYAMQYVDGQNLTDVLDGVKRLVDKNKLKKPAPDSSDPLSWRLFAPTRSTDSSSALGSSAFRSKWESGSSSKGEATDSSDRLANQSPGARRSNYFKNIAALARDVARALQYAHQQGIIHRDIKPSNLILDHSGSVWITDFGLARLESDDRMTMAGDVLGTIRYVAPEQLAGISAPSCDIYGVGVTLFELATLQPAWSGENHARVLERIRSEPVLRPRLLDSAVPLDLETIILTAMARAPADRYKSAGELADDLERFCQDRPIRARKPSTVESLWRWARRNRLAASSLAVALFVLALVIPTISAVYSLQLRAEVEKSRRAERLAGNADQASRRRWVDSLVNQARAERTGRHLQARQQALRAIETARQQLAALTLPPSELQVLESEIRNETIAALALPEFVTRTDISLKRAEYVQTALQHSSANRYVLTVQRSDGSIATAVFDQANPDRPLCTLPVAAAAAFLAQRDEFLVTQVPAAEGLSELSVWRIGDGTRVWSAQVLPFQGRVAPGDNGVLALTESGSAVFFDWNRSQARISPPLCNPGENLALDCSPDGSQVLLVWPEKFEVRSFQSGQLLRRVDRDRPQAEFEQAIWSPGGDWAAVKATDGRILVYSTDLWQPLRTLAADPILGTMLSASRDGRYLESNTWACRLQLWEVASGLEILAWPTPIEGKFLNLRDYQIGPLSSRTTAQLLEFRTSRIYSRQAFSADPLDRLSEIAVDPGSSLVAVQLNPGLGLIDLQSARKFRVRDAIQFPCFDSKGNLWGIWNASVSRWARKSDGPVSRFEDRDEILKIDATAFAVDPEARRLAWNHQAGVACKNLEEHDSEVQVRLENHDIRRLVISPDGHWLAAPGHNEAGCWLFDLQTPLQWNLVTGQRLTLPTFSPDSTWLAITVPDESLRLYRTGAWDRPQRSWGPAVGEPAFSPDGKLLAACLQPGAIELIDLLGQNPNLRLTFPDKTTCRILKFAMDGTRLLMTSEESNCLHVWDLARLKRELQARGMEAPQLPESANELESADSLSAPPEEWISFAPNRKQELEWVQEYESARADGDPTRELALLRRLRQLRPDDAYYANNLAWLLVSQWPAGADQLPEALAMARVASQRESDNPHYQNTLGVILCRLGEFEEAVAVLELARTLRGSGADSLDYFYLALCQSRLKRPRNALAEWMGGCQAMFRMQQWDRATWAAAADALWQIGYAAVRFEAR